MKLMSGFWSGVTFGFANGLLVGLWYMQYYREEIFSRHSKYFIDNMGPALIAAIATVLSAVLATGGVAVNIRNQNKIEYQRTERKLAAARSALPMALSELSGICKLYLLQISNRGEHDTSESMIMSDATQETIRTIIENSSDIMQQELSKFLACYQIAVSRFNSFIVDLQEPEDDSSIDQYEVNLIVSWASLSALVACYFDYGRGAEFEITPEKKLSAFRSELFQYAHQNNDGILIQLPIFDALRRYIFSDSVKGCGFLDPDYFKK